MNRAYKFRIYPNKEQQIFFAKTFGCVRFIYNKMLGDKIEHYKETGEKLKNTPVIYKKEYPWLKEVDSLALANAQINLQTAYNNFFRDPKVGFPKFKSKKNNRFSYTTNNQKGTIFIENGYLKLPKLKTKVKMKQHRQIKRSEEIKSATISKTPTGKYYVSILVEVPKVDQRINLNKDKIKAVGLDFSMMGIFVSSEGQIANYPRYYRKSLDKLKRE